MRFIGTFKAYTEPAFNCQKCKATWPDKKVRSASKFCDKEVPKTSKKELFRHFTGVVFKTCPSNFYQESYIHWIDLSKSYEQGNMFLDLDEPNKNVEARNFVDLLRSNYQIEQMRLAK